MTRSGHLIYNNPKPDDQQGMLLSPCATPFLHEGAASAVSSLQDRLWRLQSKTLTPPPHTHTHARKHTHKDTHMHRSTLTRASTHIRAHTRTPYMHQLHDSRHFCAHTCTTQTHARARTRARTHTPEPQEKRWEGERRAAKGAAGRAGPDQADPAACR